MSRAQPARRRPTDRCDDFAANTHHWSDCSSAAAFFWLGRIIPNCSRRGDHSSVRLFGQPASAAWPERCSSTAVQRAPKPTGSGQKNFSRRTRVRVSLQLKARSRRYHRGVLLPSGRLGPRPEMAAVAADYDGTACCEPAIESAVRNRAVGLPRTRSAPSKKELPNRSDRWLKRRWSRSARSWNNNCSQR